MKFLNKKEQVIDLQITQYGKHLISKGKFKPIYYSFFDDNILYDSQYGVGAEAQNSTQQRIKTNTPQLEAQYVFRGIETEVKRAIQDVRSSKEFLDRIHDPSLPEPKMRQPTSDKMYALKYSIGTSELNTDFSPAWNVFSFVGEISSSTPVLTGSHTEINIPQLNMKDIKYKTLVGQVEPGAPSAYGVFEDGTFIDVLTDEGSILLSIEEKNAFYGTNNFDIEVYEIKEEDILSGTIGPQAKKLIKEESLVPLSFIKEDKAAPYDILTANAEDENVEGDIPLDPTYVEYFLEINTDHEIDESLLCKYTVDRTQGIFGNRELNCEPVKKQERINTKNIYDTDVTQGDLEDC